MMTSTMATMQFKVCLSFRACFLPARILKSSFDQVNVCIYSCDTLNWQQLCAMICIFIHNIASVWLVVVVRSLQLVVHFSQSTLATPREACCKWRAPVDLISDLYFISRVSRLSVVLVAQLINEFRKLARKVVSRWLESILVVCNLKEKKERNERQQLTKQRHCW